MSAHMVRCPRCSAREAEKPDQVCEWCHGTGEVDANERTSAVDGYCEQAKERCDRRAWVVVREAPPGNPYRDLKVCCEHADEMVTSGLYFRLHVAALTTESALQRTTPSSSSDRCAVLRPPTPEGGAGE